MWEESGKAITFSGTEDSWQMHQMSSKRGATKYSGKTFAQQVQFSRQCSFYCTDSRVNCKEIHAFSVHITSLRKCLRVACSSSMLSRPSLHKPEFPLSDERHFGLALVETWHHVIFFYVPGEIYQKSNTVSGFTIARADRHLWRFQGHRAGASRLLPSEGVLRQGNCIQHASNVVSCALCRIIEVFIQGGYFGIKYNLINAELFDYHLFSSYHWQSTGR